MTPAILGITRHLLTIGAGVLVTRGVIDASAAETLVGAGAALVGVGWSIIEKRMRA